MAERQGLNCTLSYSRGSTNNTYKVRATVVTHGTQQIAEESHARTHRAFYPHRSAPQRFAVTVQAKGWSERRDLMNWLGSYGEYMVDPDLSASVYPAMTVLIPSREFTGIGVLLEGYGWGDHIGSMVFEHNLVFESSVDPGQTKQPNTSTVDNKWEAFTQDQAIQYFYPFGTQLSGNDAPGGNYDKIVYPGDPGSFNDTWNEDASGIPGGGATQGGEGNPNQPTG
jgi:hypothetical protein